MLGCGEMRVSSGSVFTRLSRTYRNDSKTTDIKGGKCNLASLWLSFSENVLTKLSSIHKICIQSDLTHPHTSVLDEIVDKVREMDK